MTEGFAASQKHGRIMFVVKTLTFKSKVAGKKLFVGVVIDKNKEKTHLALKLASDTMMYDVSGYVHSYFISASRQWLLSGRRQSTNKIFLLLK